LVECDWGTEKGVDNVWVVVKLLVNHKSKNAHLGGTTIVELNGRDTVEVEWDNGRLREVTLVFNTSLLDIGLAKTEAKLKETQVCVSDASSFLAARQKEVAGNAERTESDGLVGKSMESISASSCKGTRATASETS